MNGSTSLLDVRATKYASLVNSESYPSYKLIVDLISPALISAADIAK